VNSLHLIHEVQSQDIIVYTFNVGRKNNKPAAQENTQ